MKESIMETFAGAVCALIGTIIGIISTKIISKNDLFARTVSTNRMEWINVWRENISIFCTYAKIIYTKGITLDKDTTNENSVYDKLYMSYNRIISRLNFSEVLHQAIYIQLKNIIDMIESKDFTDDDFDNQLNLVMETARKILKPEWERVKNEAKGKRR